jgi:serine/threonine-protein kinase RsbT
MAVELRVPIRADPDIVVARQQGRRLAAELALPSSDLTLIAAAISEVARNILSYAGRGEIEMRLVQEGNRHGILVVARDQGPGIANVAQALQDGFSTGGGLGLGLPGARRLMDEFEVASEPGAGTTVTMKKWAR